MSTIDSILNLIDEALDREASASPVHYGWDEDDYDMIGENENE